MKTEKNIIRCMLLLIVISLFVGILSSCGQGNNSTNDNKTNDDVQYYNSGDLQFETEDGFYYLDNNDFINFFDYKSQQNVIVCNKPNCKHEEWDESTPDEQRCNAYQEYNIEAGFVENGKLFMLVNDPFEEITTVIRADLDCANQEVIAELESSYTKFIVVNNGKMFFANASHVWGEDEEGLPVMTGQAYTWLYCVDLENGKTTELTERKLNYNSSLRIINANEDTIYLVHTYHEEFFNGTNYEEAKPHEELYAFNMETGEYGRIELERGEGVVTYWYVYDGKLVETVRETLDDETYDITLVDIETGERETVINDATSMEMFDTDIKYSISGKNYLYNIETEESKETSEEINSRLYVFLVLDDYIFGQLDSNIYGYGEKVLITKEDYFNGEPNYIYIEAE